MLAEKEEKLMLQETANQRELRMSHYLDILVSSSGLESHQW